MGKGGPVKPKAAKVAAASSSGSSATSPATAGAAAALAVLVLAAGAQLSGLLGGSTGPVELQCGPPDMEHFSDQPATGLHVVQVEPGAICEDGAATFTARVHVDGARAAVRPPSWEVGDVRVHTSNPPAACDLQVVSDRCYLWFQVIDVDTEDGWERGATIKGPASSGSRSERLLEFADGTVDDWDTGDFVLAAGGGGSYGTPIELACDPPR